jgi:predicted ATPase
VSSSPDDEAPLPISSLALEAARGIADEFPDGVWLIELASLSDPALVAPTATRVLGLVLDAEQISAELVARGIGTQKLLLVLDNCEQVVAAAAEFADIPMRMCPNVAVLATSREIFRIGAEYVHRVPPLDVPAEAPRKPRRILEHSAVELFIARAKAQGSDFEADAKSVRQIAIVCRQLDGIPLAIDFGAARAAALGISLVANGLGDRFALLTSGGRTAVPRHRTLRAMLDWSYEPLSEAEQRLFRHLAIFSGRFSVEAAAAVLSDGVIDQCFVIEGIANLVAKSLVVLDRDMASRWYLSETIRAYALEKFVEHDAHDAAEQRLATYFRDLPQR